MSVVDSYTSRVIGAWPLAPVLFIAGVGAAMVSSTTAGWWWAGELLLVLSLAAVVVLSLRARRRAERPDRAASQTLRWSTAIGALALGPVAGTVVFSGSISTAALVPVIVVFLGALSTRYLDSNAALSTAFGAAVGVALFTVFWGAHPGEGFASLVQGSVVSLGVLCLVGLIVTIAKRR